MAAVEPERRQWGPWNFVGFWIADSFNIVSGCHLYRDELLTESAEHMDDKLDRSREWPCLVAIMDLRLGGLLNRCMLYLYDWADWCNLPHIFPCRR